MPPDSPEIVEGVGARRHVLLFPSTHMALAAEDALRRAGIQLQVVPVPPPHSAGCGLAIRVPEGDIPDACAVLERSTVRYTLEQTG